MALLYNGHILLSRVEDKHPASTADDSFPTVCVAPFVIMKAVWEGEGVQLCQFDSPMTRPCNVFSRKVLSNSPRQNCGYFSSCVGAVFAYMWGTAVFSSFFPKCENTHSPGT